jgi:quercetin dioxygenase-like cupin family protein
MVAHATKRDQQRPLDGHAIKQRSTLMSTTPATPSLDKWDIRCAAETDWIPWGNQAKARAKILGEADGYMVALVEAEAGYQSSPHEHAHAEFFYLVDGVIRNQGRTMNPGDGYAAAMGSVHTDFEVEARATYLSIFRL